MFILKGNKEIGEYLSKLIDSKGFKSKRAFCKAYLEHEHREVNDDEIKNMANRISQMLRGTKGKAIQIYDLPVFCDLLGVTCEEILSAGTSFVRNGSRVTNYSIAFSNNPKEWEDYINRDDKLILNPDEYGKTVIDYAIEFNNFEFIKYLIKNNYIWFDSRKENQYCKTFGAGTSIKRRDPMNTDTYLHYELSKYDMLRMDLIALAVKNKDRQILDELRAREIPELYYKVKLGYYPQPDLYENYNEDMIEQISGGSDEVIDYFTDSFEIDLKEKFKDGKKRSNRFIFPYISEVLEGMIRNNHGFTKAALKKCIKYNKETYEMLKKMIDESIKKGLDMNNFYDAEYREQCRLDIIDSVPRCFKFNNDGRIITFLGLYAETGIVTNIVRVGIESEDISIQNLINELNEYFDKIVDIADEYRREDM